MPGKTWSDLRTRIALKRNPLIRKPLIKIPEIRQWVKQFVSRVLPCQSIDISDQLILEWGADALTRERAIFVHQSHRNHSS